jgi:sec-independent protein translocase protein TatA
MGQLGVPELLIIGIIALLIFGPKKLPDLGSGLGKAIRDFKSAINEPEPPAPAKEEKAKDEKKEEKKEETTKVG